MKALIKCHFNYLISKMTIIISLIAYLIILMVTATSIFFLDVDLSFRENNYMFFYDSFIIAKIITIIFSIFLFSYSFLSKVDNYNIILIASGIKKTKIIITKMITISLVIFIFVYIIYFSYLLIGVIFYKNFLFESKYLFSYLNLYLICLFFGFFSVLLIQVFNNIYTIIIAYALYNLSEVFKANNSIIIRSFNLFIPGLNESLVFHYGIIHIILITFLLISINIYYYCNKSFVN